jgi:hypothetical protein
LKIQQDNILAFFLFQCIDDGMCKIQCFQKSPRFQFIVDIEKRHYCKGFRGRVYKCVYTDPPGFRSDLKM